jgi:mono/diheme cytochrome c family protein
MPTRCTVRCEMKVVQPFRTALAAVAFYVSTVAVFLIAAAGVVSAVQETARTVTDGVYSEAQAERGAAAYDGACGNCHRADLGGASGPALKEQRFNQTYAGKDLKTLFTKVATTMPRGAPGSLGESAYLDIVAHLLKENGFGAGSRDLTVDGLDGIRLMASRPKPLPAIGDYSYVEVVGCLAPGPQNSWLLTRASDPVVTVASTSATPAPAATAAPLGTQTFRLLDAIAYSPADHRGQKMYVRGLLIKLPGEQRLTISAFETLSPTCGN